jgi:hypothetical protein
MIKIPSISFSALREFVGFFPSHSDTKATKNYKLIKNSVIKNGK